jgi:hypothetical protein
MIFTVSHRKLIRVRGIASYRPSEIITRALRCRVFFFFAPGIWDLQGTRTGTLYKRRFASMTEQKFETNLNSTSIMLPGRRCRGMSVERGRVSERKEVSVSVSVSARQTRCEPPHFRLNWHAFVRFSRSMTTIPLPCGMGAPDSRSLRSYNYYVRMRATFRSSIYVCSLPTVFGRCAARIPTTSSCSSSNTVVCPTCSSGLGLWGLFLLFHFAWWFPLFIIVWNRYKYK